MFSRRFDDIFLLLRVPIRKMNFSANYPPLIRHLIVNFSKKNDATRSNPGDLAGADIFFAKFAGTV